MKHKIFVFLAIIVLLITPRSTLSQSDTVQPDVSNVIGKWVVNNRDGNLFIINQDHTASKDAKKLNEHWQGTWKVEGEAIVIDLRMGSKGCWYKLFRPIDPTVLLAEVEDCLVEHG